MRKIILIILTFLSLIMSSCSCNVQEKEQKNYDIKKLLLKDDEYYCYNSLKEIENLNFDINLIKYDNAYFREKDLIIMPFKKTLQEKIESTKVSMLEDGITLTVNIDSPRAGFEPINYEIDYLLFEIEKSSTKFNVYLYINNTNIETVYFKNRSSFYDCRILKNYNEFKITDLPIIDKNDLEIINNNIRPNFIEIYLGCYDGYYIWFQRGDSTAERIIMIGEFEFTYGYWFELYAYKDKQEKLIDLYYKGILNEYHLYQIHSYYQMKLL